MFGFEDCFQPGLVYLWDILGDVPTLFSRLQVLSRKFISLATKKKHILYASSKLLHHFSEIRHTCSNQLYDKFLSERQFCPVLKMYFDK